VSGRPTDIVGLERALAGFATEEGMRRGLAYRPDPTDVFISPFGKCGTTWMQQIVHGLRTGGDMNFAEITEVVPWIEMASDMGVAAPWDQSAHPRAFKSHLMWDDIPKGARYIVVFRDPVDAMVSLYRFFDGWFFEAGSVPLEDFADFYLNRPDPDCYWSHAASWWRQRRRNDVLLLTFEGMKRDLAGAVARVADFIGIDDRTARRVATDQARFDFMKTHARQFDDHLVRAARDAACGLPPGSKTSKVQTGDAGRGSVLLSTGLRARFTAKWFATLGAEFGLRTYGDLRRALGDDPQAAA